MRHSEFNLTRPSKQCKSQIDVVRRKERKIFGEELFCGGDEKWINYRAVLVGN